MEAGRDDPIYPSSIGTIKFNVTMNLGKDHKRIPHPRAYQKWRLDFCLTNWFRNCRRSGALLRDPKLERFAEVSSEDRKDFDAATCQDRGRPFFFWCFFFSYVIGSVKTADRGNGCFIRGFPGILIKMTNILVFGMYFNSPK